jgi:hypothetical protein
MFVEVFPRGLMAMTEARDSDLAGHEAGIM